MSEPNDVVKFKAPIFFNCIPSNMSSTFNKTPEICVSLKQEVTFLALSKARLFIDNKEVEPVIQKYGISYIPPSNLYCSFLND